MITKKLSNSTQNKNKNTNSTCEPFFIDIFLHLNSFDQTIECYRIIYVYLISQLDFLRDSGTDQSYYDDL